MRYFYLTFLNQTTSHRNWWFTIILLIILSGLTEMAYLSLKLPRCIAILLLRHV